MTKTKHLKLLYIYGGKLLSSQLIQTVKTEAKKRRQFTGINDVDRWNVQSLLAVFTSPKALAENARDENCQEGK